MWKIHFETLWEGFSSYWTVIFFLINQNMQFDRIIVEGLVKLPIGWYFVSSIQIKISSSEFVSNALYERYLTTMVLRIYFNWAEMPI